MNSDDQATTTAPGAEVFSANRLTLGDLESYENIPSTVSPLRPMTYDGPISGKMWGKVTALNSSYPDTFDWSVYDQLYNRFGAEQPRGGVVFKTAMKLVNHHSSCSKCHHAFEIDAYGRGCIHNCTFCYAKDTLTQHGFWNKPMPFPIDLAEVRKIFYTVFETNKNSKWREILEKRVPLRFGSMSDSFMWMDRKYKISQELLKILNYYDYPHIIFTRSDLVGHDDYLRLLNKDLVSVQMSISGGNEHLTRLIEPGAPSVARRLKALERLADASIWTTVRINPMFPIYPDGYYTDPKSVAERFGSLEHAPKFELFDWSFIEQLKSAKVPSILAGFVRLSSTALNSMSRETGIDMRAFFKPELLKGHGDKRFSDSEIAYYYKKVQAECIKQGIRFNTCYIGNGEKDYYQYQDLWANKKDCCDAVGNVPSFKTTSQTVPWETRIAHAPDKAMALQSIEQEKKLEIEFAHVLTKDVGLKRQALKLVKNSKEV
jgi:DNA repair photolyase